MFYFPLKKIYNNVLHKEYFKALGCATYTVYHKKSYKIKMCMHALILKLNMTLVIL